jgi:23S rRNA U2552 (ribose-2'-O)-methylase RlmE/FtsJ
MSMENVIKVKHGVKSYDIIDMMLSKVFPNMSDLVVIDLTYGVGRFYRVAKKRIKLIIGVDIDKHKWEVEPSIFYQMPCQLFVGKVLNEIVLPSTVNLIVVDPPWSHEKRGKAAQHLGISSLPYHIKYINTKSIIDAAIRLAKHLNTLLLYRYKEPLSCKHIVKVEAEVRIIHNTGVIHYGICMP